MAPPSVRGVIVKQRALVAARAGRARHRRRRTPRQRRMRRSRYSRRSERPSARRAPTHHRDRRACSDRWSSSPIASPGPPRQTPRRRRDRRRRARPRRCPQSVARRAACHGCRELAPSAVRGCSSEGADSARAEVWSYRGSYPPANRAKGPAHPRSRPQPRRIDRSQMMAIVHNRLDAMSAWLHRSRVAELRGAQRGTIVLELGVRCVGPQGSEHHQLGQPRPPPLRALASDPRACIAARPRELLGVTKLSPRVDEASRLLVAFPEIERDSDADHERAGLLEQRTRLDEVARIDGSRTALEERFCPGEGVVRGGRRRGPDNRDRDREDRGSHVASLQSIPRIPMSGRAATSPQGAEPVAPMPPRGPRSARANRLASQAPRTTPPQSVCPRRPPRGPPPGTPKLARRRSDPTRSPPPLRRRWPACWR